MASVDRTNNEIKISGSYGTRDLSRVLATLHNLTSKLGYSEIILNFSDCDTAYSSDMVGLCAQVIALRRAGVDFNLTLPRDAQLSRLFVNANWAYCIDPHYFDASKQKGYTRLPATIFNSSAEQGNIVNRAIGALLSSVVELKRSELSAFEWALNEITDNVLMHSGSKVGGLVQISTFSRRKLIEFVVCDPGVGIPTTLRSGALDVRSDLDALDMAIREGITRDKDMCQGNGLFGTSQVCQLSQGNFQIYSGYAHLTYDPKDGLHLRTDQIPYGGTLVVASINYSIPGVLENALKFQGKVHNASDYIELKYENTESEALVFLMKDESASFGSRVAGIPVRNKLVNLLNMCESPRIILDFNELALISSSFADEVFGKLFLLLGPIEFGQKLAFRNINTTIKELIDKAIKQRAAASSS